MNTPRVKFSYWGLLSTQLAMPVIEAVAGQFYLAVLMARLVGLHLTQDVASS